MGTTTGVGGGRRTGATVGTGTGLGLPDPNAAAAYGAAIEQALASQQSQGAYYQDPGGDFTISGAGAAPPPYNVYEDPAYLAFVAALDQQQQAAGADVIQRTAQVDQQLGTLLPRIAEQGVQQRRRISGDAEARGMFRSGARLRDVGLQQQGEAQRVTDANTQAAQQKTALQTAYQQQLADLARQRAEKVMELNASAAL